MIIGCTKEIKEHEYRVGLTPDGAKMYISSGHTVLIESNAGTEAGFTNEDYINNGATIVDDYSKIWAQSDMIIKVKEPLEKEYEHIRENQIIFTYLHLAADKRLTDILLEKKCVAIAYETITDENGHLPLLKPMSEIAGRLSIQVGARTLEKHFGGLGVLLSGIPGVPKANIVIIGAGVVGINACKIALGYGANVSILDININRLTEVEHIFGNHVETLYSQEANIIESLKKADLVIGSVLIPGKAAPKLIKKEYLKDMKKGSVIVDVAIDQGGCCDTSRPTTHNNPTYVVDGVIHYCVANIPGSVPRTATVGLTNATLRYGLTIANNTLEDAIKIIPGLKPGVNCYKGKLVSSAVAESFGIEYQELQF